MWQIKSPSALNPRQ